ncbi:MAG: C25 family cysteine peptidase [Anaeromyxobacter sp.]
MPKSIVDAKGTSQDAHFGMVGGELNAADLEKAGWGIMFGATVSKSIKDRLQALIQHRKEEVGDEQLCPELPPPAPRQSAQQWLRAQPGGPSLNVVDPRKGVPFYVLIVASPEDISFDFQYELDLYWGVGRLWLESPAAFERYAGSVIAYEKLDRVATARKVTIFAPDYNGKDNGAAKLLLNNLILPMANGGRLESDRFQLQQFLGPNATRDNLHKIFTGEVDGGAPAILFSGSHGLLRHPNSDFLADTQGAVLCQEWQGEPPREETYYSSLNFPRKPAIHGMVHFLFACYSVGWPKHDTFNYEKKVAIAPSPMMARLPQKLLGAENGALAVLGHVDRAWSSSYTDAGGPQEQGFVDVILRIIAGNRMGSATDQFNFRWAALTIPLAATQQKMLTEDGLEDEARNQWIRRDDARNYILHGDPAVRLKTSKRNMPPI